MRRKGLGGKPSWWSRGRLCLWQFPFGLAGIGALRVRAGGRRCVPLCLLAAGLLYLGARGAMGAPIPVFSTGAGVLPTGADAHYSLVSSPYGDAQPAVVIGQPNNQWVPNGAGVKWIGTTPSGFDALLPGEYVYRTTFDLTGLEPDTAVLYGFWSADNAGEILLNGESTGIALPAADAAFTTGTLFAIAAGFVAGDNTLEFRVTNTIHSLYFNSPTGLRVELAGIADAGAAPNLVANGGFEMPVRPAVDIYEVTQMPGWVVESGDLNHYRTYWQPAEGAQSVDMNGLAPATIYQDLATAAGAPYRIRFALAANSYPQDVKRMEVWWGSALLDTVTFDSRGRSTTNMGWVYKEYTVTAPGASTRLRFKSLNTGPYGPALDDVTVVQGGVTSARADLRRRRARAPEGAKAGDGVYQTSPSAAQTATQPALPGRPALFDVKVENDGPAAKAFVVKAVETPETGWTVAYRAGDTGITDLVTSTQGYSTPTLEPGGSCVIRVALTPGSGVDPGSGKSIALQAYADDALLDAVRAAATAGGNTANLVVNGSFEQPVVPNGVAVDGTTNVASWTIESGNVDLCRAYWQPAEGYQSIDLDGYYAVGTIFQDVATNPGTTYTLRFALSGNPDRQDIKSMEVWWGSTLVDTPTFDTRGRSRTSMGW